MTNDDLPLGDDQDRWAWWRNALEYCETHKTNMLPKVTLEGLPMHEGQVELGYFRILNKRSELWEPVGIWMDPEGQIVAYRGTALEDPARAFGWACRYPVTFEEYEKALGGNGWDDEPATVPAEIGHNLPDDPLEAMRLLYLAEKKLADEILAKPIKNQKQADAAGILAKRIGKIAPKAKAEHDTEKAPHLAAGRAVDDKWRVLMNKPAELSMSIKRHIHAFAKAEERRRERKAAEAEAEAERLRQEAAKINEPEHREELLSQADEAEAKTEVQPFTAGRTGARVSTRKEKYGEVTDYEKAALALVKMNHPDFKALIDQLANRAAKAGMPFDGMEIKERDVIR